MAASMKIDQRFRTLLKIIDIKPNDHPLHLFVSRNYANKLHVPTVDSLFYLSMWTNTSTNLSFQNESRESLSHVPHTSKKSDQPIRSIFQRMLSSSQNFPEILQPDSDDTDADRTESVFMGMDIEIFTCVHVCCLPDDEEDGIDIVLHCSSHFLTHYNVNSEVVYVRPVTVFPVSGVVIGVSSNEAFQWLTNSQFTTNLLAEVHRSSVLIRTKDIFLAPYGNFLEDPSFKRSFYFDMYVLESSPVEQGLITASTEIVLTYMGDMQAEQEHFQKKIELIMTSPGRSGKHIQGPFKDIFISDFSQILNQDISADDVDEADDKVDGPAFESKAKAIMSRNQSKHAKGDIVDTFNIEVVPQRSMFKRMLWRDQKKPNFDPLYYVGMSRKFMIQQGLFDSSYVLVKPIYSDDDCDSTQSLGSSERLCMVKCLGKEYDKSKKLFITPLCLFNMMKKPPIRSPDNIVMKRYEVEEHRSQPGLTSSQSWGCEVPVAREVQISIIPSPNYSPRAPHDEALKQYFAIPRIVKEGDVIAIRSSDDPQFWQNTGDDTENRFPCIFFKVIVIKGPKVAHNNFLMVLENTMLIQIGTEHSYIPVMMQTYLSVTPRGFWDRDNLPGLSTYVDQLQSYIVPHLTSRHSCKSLATVPPAILVAGPVGSGKTTLIITIARKLGIHVFKVNCHAFTGESSGVTEARMKNTFYSAGLYSPCILLLQSVHAVGRDRDGNTEDPRVASSFLANVMQLKNDLQQFPMIVVATTHSNKDLTHDMLDCFLHQVTIQVPTELERGELLDALLQNFAYSGNMSIAHIAQRTAGFVLGDMAALIAHAKREAFKRILKLCCSGKIRPSPVEEEDLLAAGIVVQQVDFHTALDQLQAAHSDAIGAPKIPSVTWDDVGGLTDVKLEILDTIQLPLQYPELLAAGLRRSGVLLYGPPGTGKTLLAKAVATECSLNFLSVKGPELINMYVGQSEQNIREVFRLAASATPCVIFFDELDSLAPNRGKSGDSGGVMDRVVSQLLAELDGLNKACDVFVIGATNRPDLLDPALLRPGRFDKLLFLGVSDDNDSQLRILSALTRKFQLSPDCSLDAVVEKCPFNLTGADFYALASDAMLNAVKGKIQLLEAGETADEALLVTEQNFLDALDSLSPSVTEAELHRYRDLQDQF